MIDFTKTPGSAPGQASMTGVPAYGQEQTQQVPYTGPTSQYSNLGGTPYAAYTQPQWNTTAPQAQPMTQPVAPQQPIINRPIGGGADPQTGLGGFEPWIQNPGAIPQPPTGGLGMGPKQPWGGNGYGAPPQYGPPQQPMSFGPPPMQPGYGNPFANLFPYPMQNPMQNPFLSQFVLPPGMFPGGF